MAVMMDEELTTLLRLERDAVCFWERSGKIWDYSNVCQTIAERAPWPMHAMTIDAKLGAYYDEINGVNDPDL